jgi:dipeptidyl aminopeptidase/acylaminoacyl peptidase
VDHVTTEGRASFDAAANGTLVYRESGLSAVSQPTIVDLHGRTIARLGAPGDYQTIAASPDGSQLAVEKHDLRTATGDLWLIDVASGATRQLTFDGLHHNAAVWSPTSAELAITGRPGGVRNVHLFDLGSGVHEPLLPSGPDRNPTDWSQDGRYIVYEENAPGTNFDLWALEMPERARFPLLRESFNERSGRLSPNGRFIAYVSDRTGRPEVYVRPFAAAGATGDETRVSVTGGLAPRFDADGDQLFFYALDGAVVAVEVTTSGEFGAAQPTQLFAADIRFACGAAALSRCPAPPVSWDVLGGARFLLNAGPAGAPPPTPPIRVVENWTSLLTRAETTQP